MIFCNHQGFLAFFGCNANHVPKNNRLALSVVMWRRRFVVLRHRAVVVHVGFEGSVRDGIQQVVKRISWDDAYGCVGSYCDDDCAQN